MKYYLHYVASGKSGIYGKDVFIREAKQIGVNRSLPYFIMKKLKWGDKILLGNFESRHAGEKEVIDTAHTGLDDTIEITKSLKFQDGIAHVFGYFVVSGLNITASDTLKQRLFSQLNIVSSNNDIRPVKRSCGSYTISASHIVTDTLDSIIEKSQILAKEMNEKVKYFVAGNFYELKTDIEGVNFSRSLIEVDFKTKIDLENNEANELGFIKDYDKRVYVPKKERV